MDLATRFLLFLRRLIMFFRKRWYQSTRRLWRILAFVRLRTSPQSPKRDEISRRVERRSAKSPTTVICASDTPVTSPISTSTQARPPRALNPDELSYETHENHSDGNLGVSSHLLEESRPISGSPDSARHHHESEPPHIIPPPHREDYAPHVTPPRPPSPASHVCRALHPMTEIDRYGKRKAVAEREIYSHIYPPVTTQFLR